MHRSDLHDALDAALATSRVAVILGLPRVGRSAFAREWARDRAEARSGILTEEPLDAVTLIFDHLDRPGAERFVQMVRAAEAADRTTRFVALPLDFAAADHIHTSLVGSASTLELAPLMLTDMLAERIESAAPTGPVPALAPEPVATNATPLDPDRLWLRGGLPESLAAETETASLEFRRQLIGGLLAWDFTSRKVAHGAPMDDILRWLAGRNGGELDEGSCPYVNKQDLKSVLYVCCRLGLIRVLPNIATGHQTSPIKLRKVFFRDTGLLHALQGVETVAQMRDGAGVGDSFESYAIEALIRASDGRATPQFYREDDGFGFDELDLVLDFGPPISRIVAIEFKTNPNTPPRPGFYRARAKIAATDSFVVHSGDTSRIDDPVERLDLASAIARVSVITAS